mmetsp:Transcript_2814/g.7891  ORF Transcript_2814/g.7891 Transcript_2814/m.7891 type:complete len:83 (+) Transcript_2814:21-269(+)
MMMTTTLSSVCFFTFLLYSGPLFVQGLSSDSGGDAACSRRHAVATATSTGLLLLLPQPQLLTCRPAWAAAAAEYLDGPEGLQ